MMPDKLLSVLSDQQIQNLIAYLMSPPKCPFRKASEHTGTTEADAFVPSVVIPFKARFSPRLWGR